MSVRGLAAALLAAACFFAAGAQSAELKPWTGGPAPAFELKDLEGRSHKLEAYRGKVVVLNFWATWCEPCREEMPSFNRLKKSLEGKPVTLLSVNYGEGEGRIAAFLAKVPVDFPVLLDRDSQVSKAWKVRLMPTTFILGPDGRVRYFYAGERDWAEEAMRAKLLGLAGERSGR
jgi:cytochrome c biogenesis protein CcmG, thiol:disulfide interchange protein DsbE